MIVIKRKRGRPTLQNPRIKPIKEKKPKKTELINFRITGELKNKLIAKFGQRQVNKAFTEWAENLF
jgi:hypothetical protein